MRKVQSTFYWGSDRTNDREMYFLEPVEAEYASPFDASDEDEVCRRLDELCEWHEDTTDVPVECFDATMLLPRGNFLEPQMLRSGVEADEVTDIRRQIELPGGVMFEGCRFFILYPNRLKDREEPYSWLVLVPKVDSVR